MKTDFTHLPKQKLLSDTQIKKAIRVELIPVKEHIIKRFSRPESQGSAMAYLQGLISGVERKNSWQLSEQAGHESPYAFQYLLGRATWDAEALRDEVRDYSIAHLENGKGVLSVDETGFLKKGKKSAGVARLQNKTDASETDARKSF